jgi:hypothetical protein
VRDLPRALADLVGAEITIDVSHTAHDTAKAVIGRGADDAMTVEATMPTLRQQLKKPPRAAAPAVSAASSPIGVAVDSSK